jgi:hypothetical protein
MGLFARAVAVAGAWLLLTAAAGGAQTWGPATSLTSAGEQAWSARSAALGGGGAVWVYQAGSGGEEVVAQTVDASGTLGGEQVLDQGAGEFPSVAADAAGEAVAAWYDESAGAVEVAVRAPGGSFGGPVAMAASTFAAYGADSPRLAVSPDGWAAVAFPADDPDGQRVDVAMRPPGGVFGAPEEVAPSAGDDPQLAGSIAINDSGEVVVGFTEGDAADVAVSPAGGAGAWLPAQALGGADADPQGAPPLVGIDAAGGGVAVWEEGGSLNTVAAVEAAFLGATGKLGAPEWLGIDTWDEDAPALGVSDLGEVILVESPAVQESGGFGIEPPVVVSGSTVLGRFTAPEALSDEWSSSSPDLAMNARGDAVVTYTPCCSGELVARRRAPLGSFGAEQAIPTPAPEAAGYNPILDDVSLDSFGNATLTWDDASTAAEPVYFSADGPLLSGAPPVTQPDPAEIADLLPAPVPPVYEAPAGDPTTQTWYPDGIANPPVQDDPGASAPAARAHGAAPGPVAEGHITVTIERHPAETGPARIVVAVSCASACRAEVTATLVSQGRRLKLPSLAVATDEPGTVSAPLRLSAAASRALRVPAASAASLRRAPRRRFELAVTAVAGDRAGQPQAASVELAFVRR